MRNLKEWFSANELVGIQGLPNTPQGLNKKARTQQWKKRNKDGVQGGAIEYHYSSFPLSVQQALGFEQADFMKISEPESTYQQKPVIERDEIVVSRAKLLTAIATLEEILEITHKTMKPEAKAQMVLMIYELLSEESANEKIVEMMRLVA